MRVRDRIPTVMLTLLFSGCATVIPQSEQNRLITQANAMLKGSKGEVIFLSYPSVGAIRDAVFMKQPATLDRPTQSGQGLAERLVSQKDKTASLIITGASSARTAYIIKEAFNLIDQKQMFPDLTILFMGEPKYQEELKILTEKRQAHFLFSEYEPPVKSD